MKQGRLLCFGAAIMLCGAAPPPVSFSPVEPRFARAAQEYRRLWESEGARMVAALEAAAGVAFPERQIEVFVSDGAPMISFDGRSMRLRASYPLGYRRATMVHEMGHRLAFTLPRPGDLDDHRLLYLFLYDAWTDLYGREFADNMVAIERRIAGTYDYDAAWSWALAMTRPQRQARLQALRTAAGATRPGR